MNGAHSTTSRLPSDLADLSFVVFSDYWKSNRQYQNRTHSFSAERALLRRLAHEGYIKFVEGNLDVIKSCESEQDSPSLT